MVIIWFGKVINSYNGIRVYNYKGNIINGSQLIYENNNGYDVINQF